MSDHAYDRLSAMDSSFLAFEGPTTHMHVGGAAIFEAGPLRTAGGGVDIDRIRVHIGSRLHRVPRYRQRIAYVPIENAPIWVDDEHLNLDYHVRHTSLPRPGDARQLKRLCGHLMSQPLDRSKPLWETWVVEGLAGDRFALVSKTHHCMVDGLGGVDLLTALLQPTPEAAIEEPPAWTPRPAPAGLQLLRDTLMRRAAMPMQWAQALSGALQDSEQLRTELVDSLAAALQMIDAGLELPADTPLNRPPGPHRRFDWLSVDLADVKAVKNRLGGGTVNDIVLATVAGAVRSFLEHREVRVDKLNYRVAIPVNTRRPEEHGTMGNRVAAWLITLPVDERDPRRRLARVCEVTASVKESKQARGVETLLQLAEWTGSVGVSLGVRLASLVQPYNLIVSNVPGPQVPLYMLGAQMTEGYPLVPLFDNQCLGVAVFSYLGQVCWGVNADWDRVPDLQVFIKALKTSFDQLRKAARLGPARTNGTAEGRTLPLAVGDAQ